MRPIWGEIDSPDEFNAWIKSDQEDEISDDDGTEQQFMDESGKILLLRPNKASESRNKPGNAETSKRGSVTYSQGTSNATKPGLVCILCGARGDSLKISIARIALY